MTKPVLYHNPGCSKSRGALEILRERGVDFDVVEYLKEPLDRAALEHLLDRLPGEPAELVRNDKHFAELGLDAGDYQTRGSVAALLAKHPRLMQRPVLLDGDRAVIARPSEKVVELL